MTTGKGFWFWWCLGWAVFWITVGWLLLPILNVFLCGLSVVAALPSLVGNNQVQQQWRSPPPQHGDLQFPGRQQPQPPPPWRPPPGPPAQQPPFPPYPPPAGPDR
jgi:hypothetical protein